MASFSVNPVAWIKSTKATCAKGFLFFSWCGEGQCESHHCQIKGQTYCAILKDLDGLVHEAPLLEQVHCTCLDLCAVSSETISTYDDVVCLCLPPISDLGKMLFELLLS